MLTSIRNKSVIVTGGTRGIGKGIAGVFTTLGARVCVIGRNAHDGEAAGEALRGSGGIATFCRGDVTKQADMETAVATAVAAFGGVDILCANAGIFPPTTLEEMSERAWDDVFATNLKGMLFSIKAALPYLKESTSGRIVLTSSITGPLTGYPGWSHYGASKAGMVGFMRTAALELAQFRITINAVLPGNVMTEVVRDLGQEYINATTASIPMKYPLDQNSPPPQTLVDSRNTMKHLASRETFDDLDNLGRTIAWHGLHEKMDMIVVGTNF